jgi:GAF domain-containing protein
VPPDVDADLAAVLASVAEVLAAQKELTAVAAGICELAVETLDACDHADVTVLGRSGSMAVPGTSDWVGVRLVSLENEYSEGPCLDACRNGVVVDVPDFAKERRWPQFVAKALAETPVRSGLGLPLLIAEKPIGSLNVHAAQARAFEAEDKAGAILFAVHAAVAFEAARERVELEKAIASRDLIGQAKGILMAESHITADEAFEVLRRASQRLNQKLVVVAQDLIDKTQQS